MTAISSINTAVTLLRSIAGNQTAPQAVGGSSGDVKDALGASVQKRVDDALSAFKTGKQDGTKLTFNMDVEGLPPSEMSKSYDGAIGSIQTYLDEVESHSEWTDEVKAWKAAPAKDALKDLRELQTFWNSASGRAFQDGTFAPPADDADDIQKFIDGAAALKAKIASSPAERSYNEF